MMSTQDNLNIPSEHTHTHIYNIMLVKQKQTIPNFIINRLYKPFPHLTFAEGDFLFSWSYVPWKLRHGKPAAQAVVPMYWLRRKAIEVVIFSQPFRQIQEMDGLLWFIIVLTTLPQVRLNTSNQRSPFIVHRPFQMACGLDPWKNGYV